MLLIRFWLVFYYLKKIFYAVVRIFLVDQAWILLQDFFGYFVMLK